MKDLSTKGIVRLSALCIGLILFGLGRSAALADGVVCFGDSITAGSGGYAGYPAHLSNMVSYTVVNEGQGGERTSAGVNRISGSLAGYLPQFIIIMEGANDVLSGFSPSTTKFNLGVMIDKSVAAGAQPILSTITPNTKFRQFQSTVPLSYNPQIIALAGEKGVTLIDSYGTVVDNWASLTTDGLHTNDQGSITLAQGFAPALNSGGGGGGGGGCFIATAAFGSYLEPQVKLLRDFRDQFLLTNGAGSFFVETYYRYSPPIADLISRHDFLKAAVRASLYPLIGMAYLMVRCGLDWGALLVVGTLLALSLSFAISRVRRTISNRV